MSRAPLALLSLLLLVSCASVGRQPVPSPPGSPGGFPQVAPHVSRWKGRATQGGESSRFRLGLLVAPGGLFVLELSTPVGANVLQASHDGERVVVLIPRERVFLDEPATEATIERLLGLPLPPGALVATMVGTVLPPGFPGRSEGTATVEGRVRRGASGWPTGGFVAAPGGGEVRVEYGDFTPAASGVLPRSIDLFWDDGDARLTVRLTLRDAHTVADRPAEVFGLEVPDRFRRVALDEMDDGTPLLFVPAEEP